MGRWIHRSLWGVAVIGILSALISTLATGRQQRRTLVEQQQAEHRVRAQTHARSTFLRPLDPAIQQGELAHELKRKVLGLYDSAEEETSAESNPIHLRLELVLNHLGLLVDLQDVNQPLPDETAMVPYRGIVAWFNDQTLKEPTRYLEWLKKQLNAGRKVVLLNGLGAENSALGVRTPANKLNELLAQLGLRYEGKPTVDAHRIKVEQKDPSMVEFERPLPRRLPYYEQLKLIDPAGRSYLRLSRLDLADSDSDVVVVTSRGGYVGSSYVMEELPLGRHLVMQWRIDPFRFLAEALGVAKTPRPDFTTLNGTRIFYSHIDGDGFPSISEVDRKSLCADFTRQHLLEPYPLPVTVSFVAAELMPPPAGFGTAERLRVARRIAALPNVEVASHGYAHPMNWRARRAAVCSYEIPGYRMDAEQEIVASTRFFNATINPAGKPTMVMLWTGWCNPAADQLALAEREGLYNLNGGDPRMDGEFPSYLHLAPPIHRVGQQVQYYTSGPNDYILTEEWRPPFHRIKKLIEMFDRTDAPRRVSAMNVYYHFYIAQKKAALNAMKAVLDYVVRKEPASLWVSEYIDVVRDFADLRLEQIQVGDEEHWRVLNSGYARTIRFDRLDCHLDLERSRGVIGYRRRKAQGATYFHLDEGHEHLLVLSPRRSSQPYLLRATSYVDGFSASKQRATFLMRGFGIKSFTLSNMQPMSRFVITAENEQHMRLTGEAISDGGGALHFTGAIHGQRIQIAVELRQR